MEVSCLFIVLKNQLVNEQKYKITGNHSFKKRGFHKIMLSEISDSPKNLKNSTLFGLTESYFNSVKRQDTMEVSCLFRLD
jgi:hypothetical protein